jgi:membrane protein implicated in regulation of membrane protease activity
MTWWAWMILGAVLLGAELFAVDAQFYLVFLGVSAAIVGFALLFGVVTPEWVQWLSFGILSLLFFLTFRRTLYMKIRGGGEEYRGSIAGESISVSTDLPAGADARTTYRGTEWNIRNIGEAAIPAGSRAKVVEVDGLTLNVKAE